MRPPECDGQEKIHLNTQTHTHTYTPTQTAPVRRRDRFGGRRALVSETLFMCRVCEPAAAATRAETSAYLSPDCGHPAAAADP
jgi:hypothetical protein